MVTENELIAVSGADALDELRQSLAEAPETGYHPILVGDAADYDQILEGIEEGEDPEAILSKAERISASEWFMAEQDDGGLDSDLLSGEWPSRGEIEEEMGIITHLDLRTHKPKPEVLIRNFKIPAAWQAFAQLSWGGWNDCPTPAEHCAIHRYWAEKYGAEVVSITYDTVQCIVSRPPTDRDAAMKLAIEQYLYCGDIVDQGCQSITDLAASLMNSDYWYFWWD